MNPPGGFALLSRRRLSRALDGQPQCCLSLVSQHAGSADPTRDRRRHHGVREVDDGSVHRHPSGRRWPASSTGYGDLQPAPSARYRRTGPLVSAVARHHADRSRRAKPGQVADVRGRCRNGRHSACPRWSTLPRRLNEPVPHGRRTGSDREVHPRGGENRPAAYASSRLFLSGRCQPGAPCYRSRAWRGMGQIPSELETSGSVQSSAGTGRARCAHCPLQGLPGTYRRAVRQARPRKTGHREFTACVGSLLSTNPAGATR